MALSEGQLERALADLNRVKPGDTYTHFEDGVTLEDLFALAPATIRTSLIGMEILVAGDDGVVNKILIGTLGGEGGDGGETGLRPWDAKLSVRMARMVWYR